MIFSAVTGMSWFLRSSPISLPISIYLSRSSPFGCVDVPGLSLIEFSTSLVSIFSIAARHPMKASHESSSFQPVTTFSALNCCNMQWPISWVQTRERAFSLSIPKSINCWRPIPRISSQSVSGLFVKMPVFSVYLIGRSSMWMKRHASWTAVRIDSSSNFIPTKASLKYEQTLDIKLCAISIPEFETLLKSLIKSIVMRRYCYFCMLNWYIP